MASRGRENAKKVVRRKERNLSGWRRGGAKKGERKDVIKENFWVRLLGGEGGEGDGRKEEGDWVVPWKKKKKMAQVKKK